MKKAGLKNFARYIVIFIIFILAFVLTVIFFNTRKSAQYESPVKPVMIARAEYRNLDLSFTVTGYIEADAMIPVIPFVSGNIEEYYLTEGSYIEKDSVVAIIDRTPYELQKAQAVAQYTALESALERTEALYSSGAASRQDYETLLAQRDASSAQLDLADLQLSYTDVKAPISGTVVMSMASKGSVGAPGEVMAVLADLDNLVVNASVPEKYFDIFKESEGMNVTVTRPSSSAVSDAKIVSVAPYVDPTTKTFKVKISLENTESFVPGMYVRVTFNYSENKGWSLPLSARSSDGGVYYVDEEGRARYIKPAQTVENGKYFIIPEEYRDYDFIAVGSTSLLDGELVNVVGEVE